MQPTLRSHDAAMVSARKWQRLDGTDDYASVRAYLMNQLVFEGGMYRFWDRSLVAVLEQAVYETLPPLNEVDKKGADIAWMIYDLPSAGQDFVPRQRKIVYTKYPESWGNMMREWTKTECHFAKAVKKKYWETIIRCDKHGNEIG